MPMNKDITTMYRQKRKVVKKENSSSNLNQEAIAEREE